MNITNILVTVGTTKFPALIETICQQNTLKILASKGCKKLCIQAGDYSNENLKCNLFAKHGIEVEIFDYKPDLVSYIEQADLIISHSGAGSCLEVLRARKRLIVVINERLMDNHQAELGQYLHDESYAICTNTDQLGDTLRLYTSKKLRPFPKSNVNLLTKFVDSILN